MQILDLDSKMFHVPSEKSEDHSGASSKGRTMQDWGSELKAPEGSFDPSERTPGRHIRPSSGHHFYLTQSVLEVVLQK